MYMQVEFIKTDEKAVIPKQATNGAAGMDLTSVKRYVLPAGGRVLVETGLKIALEKGYEAQIRPRSGLALKHGITVLNSPGTIDADYRGPVGIILVNHGNAMFVVEEGDRVAQMVVKPVCGQVVTKCVEKFSDPATLRGEDGYGSTGS